MTASRRRFSQEFKDELCQEVISTSKPIREVAEPYGVGPETLRNWLTKYRDANGGTEEDLERENQDLRAETAFLKKPALTSRGSSDSEQVRIHRFPEKRSDRAEPGDENVPVVDGVDLGFLSLVEPPTIRDSSTPRRVSGEDPTLLHSL
jgi:transposase